MRPARTASLLLLLACTVAHADMLGWPRLNGTSHSALCQTALALAQAAHHSEAFRPADAPPLPRTEDGDFAPPEEVFTQISDDPVESRLYWQKQPLRDRLVIEAESFGWRGDAFTVRLLPQAMTAAEYRQLTQPGAEVSLPTVLRQSWQAPLVFQQEGRRLWLIDPGSPSDFSPDWQVYAVLADRFQPLCQIQFRPGVKKAAVLLPRPVQRLADLLLQSLGTDDEQGSYHPVAGLQLTASQARANVALRPWALATAGYNQRSEVDAGLAGWARKSLANQRLLAQMQEQYPLAQSALVVFYQRQHGMEAGAAEATARTALDAALRTHFTFPKAR